MLNPGLQTLSRDNDKIYGYHYAEIDTPATKLLTPFALLQGKQSVLIGFAKVWHKYHFVIFGLIMAAFSKADLQPE
jgi:hypothetical protein